MEIKVDKLRRALILLETVVPKKKATLPIINNVWLHDGKVTATNLEVCVSVNLPEATEECLLPFKDSLEMLKYVPGSDVLAIEPAKKLVKFSWEDGKASYTTDDPKEFPPIPTVEVVSEAPVNGDMLIAALTEMAKYASTDDTRPVLTAVNLQFSENGMDVAGADGFRLALKTFPQKFPTMENINVPPGTVETLQHMWKHAPSHVALKNDIISQITQPRLMNFAIVKSHAGSMLLLQFGDVTLISQLIEGNFPDYRQLVPDTMDSKTVTVFGQELMVAINRLKGIARDSASIVRFSWTDEFMVVAARSEEIGDMEAKVKVQPGAIPGRVAISLPFILNYLKGKDGMVTMSTTGGSAPVVFEHGNSPKVVIMPMFVQWGDEPKKEEAPKTEETVEPTNEVPETEEPENEYPGDEQESQEREEEPGESDDESTPEPVEVVEPVA